MKTLLSTLMLAALSAAAAAANILPITVAFDQLDQTGMPGQTLQFFGTLTNTTADPVFLNSDDLNPTGLSITSTDLFFANVPLSLAPAGQAGDSSGDIELFDLTLTASLRDATGTYPGTYTLLGGADGNAQDIVGSAGFSVTTVTPEPSTIYLLLTVLFVVSIRVLWAARKRAPSRII
jgi:hypothetical protein